MSYANEKKKKRMLAYMRPDEPNDGLPPNFGLTVGFIGSVILSLGYIVGTIGEGIALYEANRDFLKEERAAQEGQRAAQDQQKQISEIQDKLDSLLDQMEAMKKEQEKNRNCNRHKRG